MSLSRASTHGSYSRIEGVTLNLLENSKEKKTKDFSTIQWSIRSGVYKDFYLGKQVNGRKTESGRFPRWAQPTWACQGAQARPGVLCPPRLPSWLFLIFLIFVIFQNWQKIFVRIFRSPFTYRITYLLFFTILECSERFLLCVPPVSWFE